MSLHLDCPHTAKVGLTFKHSTEAVQCENTFYLQDPTDNMFSDFNGLATQIYNAAVAQLVPHMYPVVVFNGVVLEDVRSIPYGGSDYPQTDAPGTKAASTGSIPTVNALSVSKITGTFGRSYRGRWFWPIWDKSDLASADVVNTVRANEITTALAAFQTAVETGTYPCNMGIVSQQINKVPRAHGVFYQIVKWRYSDLRVDSQRRRLLGRGS